MMRNYLYLWHRPEEHRLIVSGIEFGDLLADLTTGGGVVLLKHNYLDAQKDRNSGLDFVDSLALADLAKDDIYSYGDFHWVDFGLGNSPGQLTDDAIAELLFYSHKARPLRAPAIAGLKNRFLWSAHDDGWYASVTYTQWPHIRRVLRALLLKLLSPNATLKLLKDLRQGTRASWCQKNSIIECEKTSDINSLQRMYLSGKG